MDQAAVVNLLSSWAAWSRSDDPGLDFRPQAGSIEGRYLPPAGAVFDDHVAVREVIISDDAARRIELAVLSAGRTYAALLTSVFVGRLPLSMAAHRLHLPGDPRLLLGQALRQVGDRLA